MLTVRLLALHHVKPKSKQLLQQPKSCQQAMVDLIHHGRLTPNKAAACNTDVWSGSTSQTGSAGAQVGRDAPAAERTAGTPAAGLVPCGSCAAGQVGARMGELSRCGDSSRCGDPEVPSDGEGLSGTGSRAVPKGAMDLRTKADCLSHGVRLELVFDSIKR